MSLTPSHDKLPESFFTALYPELDAPVESGAPASAGHNDRLARLIEHWPGAVFCLDTQLHCLLANREARTWCAPHTGTDAPLHELLSPELMEALLPYVSAALRGMELAFDDHFQHPTLGLRHLSIRTQPDHDGPHVAGVFLHLQDSTDLRQAHQLAQDHLAASTPGPSAHADHDRRLHLMAEHLRDTAIFCLDPLGCVTDWPASAQHLLGYDADVVLGISVHSFDDPHASGETPDTLLALERATFLGQYDSTGWRVRQDGTRFWSQLVLTALHDLDSGASLGYACLLRDMTEVKRLEDLLRQWNQELEARVQERTQQLQDINQDLEAFSYSVSHDLRAPLRHIGSFVEMLRDDLGPDAAPGVLKHLHTIDHSAQHMGQLIEGLLAFSRLGRAPLARREVAMGALLQSSLNRVQHDPALQRPAHAVRWQLATDLPTVQGDAMLLSQVWDNLLSNALKYSRKRDVADIAVSWQREATGELVFTVQDNGVGFDPQRADRLFGVFQRLHRASEFEGTGIGLALCRRIVERHGGRIWAESEPGQGSRFSFALPNAAQAAVQAAGTAAG
jgi:PAS domain S-box-containing protein